MNRVARVRSLHTSPNRSTTMNEPPLQSAYDALQSLYDEVASMRLTRQHSTRSSLSVQSPRPNPDHSYLPERSMQPAIANLDLRDLEYVDPELHLLCPICHIPFIDPVFVNCGHYFCAECLETYWKAAPRSGDRKPCPACRSTVTSRTCAPRLIVNMCNDVKVKCPSKECAQIVARGALQSHVTFYCPERRIECPARHCKKTTKRRHLLLDQCRHTTHVECECGDLVLLEGLGKHREVQCPVEKRNVLNCQLPLSSQDGESDTCELKKHCPGEDFGCDVRLNALPLEEHAKTCTMAKMAPHLKAHVANSLAPLQDELLRSQQRVRGLEEGIDKLLEAVDAATQKFKQLRRDAGAPDSASHAAVPRSDPTPDDHALSSTSSASNFAAAAIEPAQHRHLLALHENLRNSVAELGMNLTQLTRTVEEVDARNSMLTMNETLRLKEELSLTNNGLYSTRAQVQWLLNRERTGQQQQPGIRGRPAAASAAAAAAWCQGQTSRGLSSSSSSSSNLVSGADQPRPQQQQQQQQPGIRGRPAEASVSHTHIPTNEEPAGAGPNGPGGSTPSALTALVTSPVRRTSGGSQERVKL
jgi:Zinc finger, C3HC4 type (RING finger)/TRAF-type zinc finger